MVKERRGKELPEGKPRGRGKRSSSTLSQRNILEREQQIQETLRHSEERFRALVENLSDVVTIIDSLGVVRYQSPNYKAVWGRAPAGEIGRDMFKDVHPDDAALVGEKFDYLLKNPRGTINIDVRAQHTDGSWHTIEVVGRNLLDNPAVCGIVVNFRDITEHKQAEESLRLSEQNSRDSIEKSPLGIRIVTADGKTLYVNKTLLDICGYGSLEELKAVPRKELYTPESYVEHRERVNKRKRREYVPSNYEISIVRKDGQVRWLSVSRGEVLWDGEKQFQVVYQDITERKRAEIKYKKIIETTIDGFWIMDSRGRFLDVNDSYCRMIGYTREELLKMGVPDVEAVEKPEDTAERIKRVIKQGYDRFETRHRRKDGKIIELGISAMYLEARDEQFVVFIRDITERKKTEEALRQSEERYRTLLEEMEESYYEVDIAGNFTFVNDAMCRILGYSRDELIGINYKIYTPQEDVKAVFEAYNRVYRTGEPLKWFPMVQARKDGIQLLVEDSILPMRNDKGEVIGFRGVSHDVTERKRAEEALRQSEERYRAILEKMEDSYFEVDLAGNLTFVNSAACRHLRYSREEIIGMSYKNFTAEEDIESVFRVFNEVYRTATPNKGFHWKIIRKDGSPGLVDASVAPLQNDKGEIIGFRGVGRDITERRKMEEQLIFTDRLASIGQLAAGIAHELNNPLTGVIGFSDLLLERDLPADVKEDLKTINQEALRATNIVKGLLAFAHEQRTEKSLVNINAIIQGILQLRSYEQRVGNIEVDARFTPTLPPVMGNGVQLQQVFLNIIINAEQAMLEAHGRGKLTTVTEQVGDMVRASITDDGKGISPDNMKKLFTPFFTTKEVGRGTGLGLSICHGIVIEHGGNIYAESEPGKGVTFFVELPVSK